MCNKEVMLINELQEKYTNNMEMERKKYEKDFIKYNRLIKEKYAEQFSNFKDKLENASNNELKSIKQSQTDIINTECDVIHNKKLSKMKNKIEREQNEKYKQAKSKYKIDTEKSIKEYENKLKNEYEKRIKILEEDKINPIRNIIIKKENIEKFELEKKNSIAKHKLNTELIRQEYELKMKLLPKAKISNSNKCFMKFEHEKLLENFDNKNSHNEDIYELKKEISKYEVNFKEELNKEFEESKNEYKKITEKKLSELENYNKNSETELPTTSTILDINATLKELKYLEEAINKEKNELDNINEHKNQLERDYNGLVMQNDLLTSSLKMDIIYNDTELNKELSMKKNLIKELRTGLNNLIKKNKISTQIIYEKQNKDSADIKRSISLLEDIKKVLKSKKKLSNLEDNMNANERKREFMRIKSFVTFEKERLLEQKKILIKDRDTLTKLINSNKINFDEVNDQLKELQGDPFAYSLYIDLDQQTNVLSKGLDKIEYYSLK